MPVGNVFDIENKSKSGSVSSELKKYPSLIAELNSPAGSFSKLAPIISLYDCSYQEYLYPYSVLTTTVYAYTLYVYPLLYLTWESTYSIIDLSSANVLGLGSQKFCIASPVSASIFAIL